MKIGEKLKELRKERGLKQTEIAEKLNVKQGTYSDYERNKHEPSLDILVLIEDE